MSRLASTCFPRTDDQVRAAMLQRVEYDTNGGCWLWTGATLSNGYGVQNYRGQSRKAHRVAYELFQGPIEPGLTIDHLCRVRCCVNPQHMEPVTPGENSRRGVAAQPRRTSCRKGHPYTPENTRMRAGSTTERICRICAQEANRRNKKKGRRHVP